MTQDEIIEMAREAGLYQDINVSFHQALRNFYDLAAAKEQKKWQDQTAVEIHEAVLEEREACAKLAKEYAAEYKEGGRLYPMLNGSVTKAVASACDHIVYIIGERGKHD